VVKKGDVLGQGGARKREEDDSERELTGYDARMKIWEFRYQVCFAYFCCA
jgi:hypothetical protein